MIIQKKFVSHDGESFTATILVAVLSASRVMLYRLMDKFDIDTERKA